MPSNGRSEDTGDAVRMRPEIGQLQAIAIMTGVVIGSGIFVSPVSIIQNCGSAGLALVVWGVSGPINICICLCYAELGALYPKAGGEYAYFFQVLGPVPAFLNLWMQFLVIKPTFMAILALTTSNYLLYPMFPDCLASPAALRLTSIWIVGRTCKLQPLCRMSKFRIAYLTGEQRTREIRREEQI